MERGPWRSGIPSALLHFILGNPRVYQHSIRSSIIGDGSGREQYLIVSSTEDEVLKRWKYTPESVAEDPFFQESSWRFYQKEYETNSELELTWVYDLRPEDLVSDETVY